MEGPKAPNISNLAKDINTSRATVMNYIKNLADGYFVLPYTIQNYLADQALWAKVPTDRPEFGCVCVCVFRSALT